MLFAWNETLKVGVAAIDNDHKEIIELINDASAIASRSTSHSAVAERLHRLGNVFRQHFLKEQALMTASGYSGYPEHTSQHDEFLDAYRSMIALSGGGRQRTDGAISFALKFIIGHRSCHDAKLAEHLEFHRPRMRVSAGMMGQGQSMAASIARQ